MKRILLITHTEATHSVDNLVGGWFNSSLTYEGRQKAKSLKKKIIELGFDLKKHTVYSSDLKRARQTAEIIFDSNVKIILDNRLREMSFGKNEGISQSEHMKSIQYPPENGDRLNHRICEGAESLKELATRVSEFVYELMQTSNDVIIVSHCFSSSFIIAAFQNIDVGNMDYIDYKLRPGSISLLEVDSVFYSRSIKILNN